MSPGRGGVSAKGKRALDHLIRTNQGPPIPVYVGMTSKPGAKGVAERLVEHERMATKGGRCPLHVAMRKHRRKWSSIVLETVNGTYYDAKKTERKWKDEYARRTGPGTGAVLANRSTLKCNSPRAEAAGRHVSA